MDKKGVSKMARQTVRQGEPEHWDLLELAVDDLLAGGYEDSDIPPSLVEALERLAVVRGAAVSRAPIIAVHVRGGLVESVQATAPGVRVLVVDHDAQNGDGDDAVWVGDERVWLCEHEPELDADAVARYLDANASDADDRGP